MPNSALLDSHHIFNFMKNCAHFVVFNTATLNEAALGLYAAQI